MNRRAFLFIILTLAAALLLWRVWPGHGEDAKDSKAGAAPVRVVVAAAAAVPMADRIDALGTLQAENAAALTVNVSEPVVAINFQEGQPVKKGDVLIQLDDAAERATLEETHRAYKRYSGLVQNNAASVARQEEERSRMEIAQAAVNDRRIVAPFDGIAGLRRINLGDMATPGTVVTTVDQIDPLEVLFSVPESFLSMMRPGLTIEARSQAFPGEFFKGEVVAVDTRIDTETRSLSAKAEIPNPDLKLRPGMLMNIAIIRNQRQALAVPEAALLSRGERQSVLVVDPEGKVTSREIEIGARQVGYVEVLKGLKPGENVIVEGLQKARPGAKVDVAKVITIAETIRETYDSTIPRKQEAMRNAGVMAKPAAGSAP